MGSLEEKCVDVLVVGGGPVGKLAVCIASYAFLTQ